MTGTYGTYLFWRASALEELSEGSEIASTKEASSGTWSMDTQTSWPGGAEMSATGHVGKGQWRPTMAMQLTPKGVAPFTAAKAPTSGEH
jgi:hypothetical protein